MTRVEVSSGPAIMLVAGEPSGDLHGAALCRALKKIAPAARVFGMGGARMAAEGVDLVTDVSRRAAVGGTEAVGRLPALWRAFRALRARLLADRPAVLVLVDFPEFNLRLATIARRVGVPVVYFIPPQLWAWRRGRLHTLRQRVSLVLAVLPFEPAIYRQAGVPVAFVGHPVVDALAEAPSREVARAGLGFPNDGLVVGILPGSRATEVRRMTPLGRDAAGRIAVAHPEARFVVGLAPTVDRDSVERALLGGPPTRIVVGATHAVIRAADLLIATSGTVTLEAAMLGTPMVVCYRVSWLTQIVAQPLLRVPWIGLANLALGRGVVPELVRRHEVTGARIAAEALALLETPGALEAQRDAFRELGDLLGEPGVGARAARLVLATAGSAA